MNFCAECGSKVADNAKFCMGCGTRLVDATPSSEKSDSSTANAPLRFTTAPPASATPTSPAIPAEIPYAVDRDQSYTPLESAYGDLPASMFDPAPGDPDWKEPAWSRSPEGARLTNDAQGAPTASSTPPPWHEHRGVADGSIELWNPSALIGWTFMLTPLFGGWMTARNWRLLGEEVLARRAALWAYCFPLAWAASMLISLVGRASISAQVISMAVLFGYYVAWILVDAIAQKKLIDERYADAYQKKSWAGPLCFAFGGWFMFLLVLATMVAYVAMIPSTVQ